MKGKNHQHIEMPAHRDTDGSASSQRSKVPNAAPSTGGGYSTPARNVHGKGYS